MIKKGDYIRELSDYIKKNLKKGYTAESLKWALVSQGHSKLEVEKAVKKAEEDMSKEAPVLKTKPEISYDVFGPKDTSVEEKIPFWKRMLGM